MITKDILLSWIVEVGNATGTPLSNSRVQTYYEKLKDLPYEAVRQAKDSIIDTWESPNHFPPVGVFVKKAKDFAGYGNPNAYSNSDPNTAAPKKADPKIVQALKDQEKWLKMDGNQYMDMLIKRQKEIRGG